MNMLAPTFSDPHAFLRWNEDREGFRELVDGVVEEMMVGSTVLHNRRIATLEFILKRDLAPKTFDIASQGLGVVTGRSVRYPDVVVCPFENDNPRRLDAPPPILVAEVLSPSSLGRDFVAKRDEYLLLPSLRHYLILSPDEPRLWQFRREAGGDWSKAERIEGADASLPLAAFGIAIALAELYEDVIG